LTSESSSICDHRVALILNAREAGAHGQAHPGNSIANERKGISDDRGRSAAEERKADLKRDCALGLESESRM
jgi:hypothetical protein